MASEVMSHGLPNATNPGLLENSFLVDVVSEVMLFKVSLVVPPGVERKLLMTHFAVAQTVIW